MTKDETKMLLALITCTYPNWHLNNPEKAVEVWHKILEPDEYRLIENAFVAYTRTNTTGFAPSPGQLHMLIADEVVSGKTDGEVLNMLILASRNANYGFEEEFQKMPPLLQKAIGTSTVIRSWGGMEQKDLEYAHDRILRNYKTLLEQNKINIAKQGINANTIKAPLLKNDPTLQLGELT